MFSPEDHRFLTYAPRSAPVDHRRWKTTVEIAPNCPRCDSSNTKFCYYNNYSLTQPRYFCKGCRRYWTKGGSLRNVPVGGGCRKNRRGKSIRLNSTDAEASSTAIAENNSARALDTGAGLRPDQALDDMFDNYPGSDAGGGPNIDMAVMYARYLNQTAPPDPKLPEDIEDSLGFVAGELSSSSTPSTDMNCQAADEANLGFMASNFNCGVDQAMGDYGFAVGNGRCLESAAIFPAMSGGDAFSMNWGSVYPSMLWPGQEGHTGAANQPRPPPEIGSGNNTHFQELLIGDWSSTMEQSGFEAF